MKKKGQTKSGLIKKRQEKEKTALLEKLEEWPLVSRACARAKVSRATFYRWINEDESFARKVEETKGRSRDMVNDIAESGIIKKLQESDMQAIKYWLANNHPAYGKKYVERHTRKRQRELDDLDRGPARIILNA